MSAQQVAPTRMALQTYKGKLLGAKKGYELLKKKSDALKVGACCASGSVLDCGSERLSHRAGKEHLLAAGLLQPGTGKHFRCK